MVAPIARRRNAQCACPSSHPRLLGALGGGMLPHVARAAPLVGFYRGWAVLPALGWRSRPLTCVSGGLLFQGLIARERSLEPLGLGPNLHARSFPPQQQATRKRDRPCHGFIASVISASARLNAPSARPVHREGRLRLATGRWSTLRIPGGLLVRLRWRTGGSGPIRDISWRCTTEARTCFDHTWPAVRCESSACRSRTERGRSARKRPGWPICDA